MAKREPQPSNSANIAKKPPSPPAVVSSGWVQGLLTALAALLLWWGAVELYQAQERKHITDSSYQLLLSEALLRDHSFALDRYLQPPLDPQAFPGQLGPQPHHAAPGYPYQIEVLAADGQNPQAPRVYLWYPNAPSLLALPYAAWYRLQGESVLTPQGSYNAAREVKLQQRGAGWLAALSAVLLLLLARTALGLLPSLLIGAAFAVASPLWSTASQALWTSTWGGVLTLLALLQLARGATGKAPLRPLLLGTLCAWMYFCRPALAVEVLAITAWVAWRDRRAFVQMGLTGALWGGLFAAASVARSGRILPSYFRHTHLNFDRVAEGFYGSLASPSRGLLVYTPFLLAALWLLLRFRRQVPQPSLAAMALLGTLGHAALLACYPNWWGGHSFGARLMIDTLPLTALWSAQGLAAALHGPRVYALPLAGLAWLTALASVALGGWIHQRGVQEPKVAQWNSWPQSIDQDPRRALDWRLPQFMAGLWPQPPPEPLPPLAWNQPLAVGKPEAQAHLLHGWGNAEGQFRWTDGQKVGLCAQLPGPGPWRLQILARPYLDLRPGGRGPKRQRLRVMAGQTLIGQAELTKASGQLLAFEVPASVGPQVNLSLELPDARSPKSSGEGQDTRELGLAIAWVQAARE
jgi:hypothetical protein